MSAGCGEAYWLKRNNWLFGCRRISPFEVNGHQMFASAGEEERVPARTRGERKKRRERKGEKGETEG